VRVICVQYVVFQGLLPSGWGPLPWLLGVGILKPEYYSWFTKSNNEILIQQYNTVLIWRHRQRSWNLVGIRTNAGS
jgi:hypothetical protein